jgi:ParB family chromosome partitioning protein
VPGKFQPRKLINDETLSELAASIKSQGVIQPIVVRRAGEQFEIIAGERRWRAAKLAELTHVPAVVRHVADNIALAFALIENIQREDLNPIEEAMAYERFYQEFQMNHSDIADMVGKSRSSVSNAIRLLSLSEPVKKLVEEGALEMGHARALLSLTPEEQAGLAEKIVAENLTVREAEKRVQLMKQPKGGEGHLQKEPQKFNYADKYHYWSSELSKKFSSEVSIKLNNDGKGKVIIHVESPDDVDWLIDHINIH